MHFQTFLGTPDFLESLRGKRATFLLSLSNTKTYEIENITQAGLPGHIHLTPTLDAEFVCVGQLRSMPQMATTPKGVPTPALITRAVHLLHPFLSIELLNLGLEVTPDLSHFKIHDFDLLPSENISKGANINAMEVFQKGLDFGQNYTCKDEYIILAESVPAGTTTAQALAQALGYQVDGLFASSFKESPSNIKSQTIDHALANIFNVEDVFERLNHVGDNMLIFNAGFLLGLAANQTKVVLAGGTQMATVLLLVNSLVNIMGGEYDASNTALCTTKWILDDESSDIKAILQLLDFDINAYASDFSFSDSSFEALKLYDEGEAKEGVGAGGALCYGALNAVNHKDVINQIEGFLS